MSARAVAIAVLSCGLAACAGGTAESAPLWTRPGFEGAIRPEMGHPQPGDLAPDFTLPVTGSDGDSFHLSDMRGQWVVVHFTTTWCPFCDEEVEHLDRLASDYASRNVRAVLIDVLEEHDHWTEYLRGRLPEGKVVPLEDHDGQVARSYAPTHLASEFKERAHVVLASTLIVDPTGKVQLFLIPDSQRFDPTFAAARTRLDELIGVASTPATVVTKGVDEAEATLPPEKVLQVRVEDPQALAPGASSEVVVHLSIVPGYHVMANPPSKPNYIPTTAALDCEGVAFAAPNYPSPTPFAFSDETIATLQGEVTIRIPFALAEDAAPGAHPAHLKLDYQACTESSCLFPTSKDANFVIRAESAPGNQ